MGQTRFAGLAAALTAVALALIAAQRPVALADAVPGMWELDGVPGAPTPVRQCIADVAALVQFEHRSLACPRKVLSDGPGSAVVEYSCGSAGFGHSKVDVITPRSLRIETQGVSSNQPFSYVLQARRVGDCPAPPVLPRH